MNEVERDRRLPPRPSHEAYDGIASALGVPAKPLRRAATRDRFTLVEGTPWLKRKR